MFLETSSKVGVTFSGILVCATMFVGAQSPTAPALDFNVFVKNNAKLVTNETEGPVALGGNLVLAGNYRVAMKNAGTFKSGAVTVGLVVGGKIEFSGGNQTYVNNGYIKLGDCTGAKVWYKDNNGANGNLRVTSGSYDAQPSLTLQTSAAALGVSSTVNPVCQAGLIDFTKAFSTMQASAKVMAAYATNIEFTNPNGDRKGNTITSVLTNGQIKVNLKSGINVMNVSGAELNNVTGGITFNNAPNATRILIVNVNAASAYTWKVWNQSGLSLVNCPYIIYNFYNTTSLQVHGNSTIEGTLYAPFADIIKTVNQANIEGQVIGLSYYQSGGENHYANFLPSLLPADSDGDGVADKDDNYPKDATKAFNNPYPSTDFNSLMYEDLWPYKGDYDFNDLVIDYRFNTITNAANNVAEIEYIFIPRAAGATLKNAFAFQLDHVLPSKITSVTGSKMKAGWCRLNANGTEAGHPAHANIIVTDNVFSMFNNVTPATTHINTYPNVQRHTADTIKIVVKFQANSLSYAALTSVHFNPYLIVDQVRGREVHLADRIPSARIDPSYFGKGSDATNTATKKYFKTATNLPWALQVSGSIPYPIELLDFTGAYLNFIKWASSAGTTNMDWYLNKQGYRNTSKLY